MHHYRIDNSGGFRDVGYWKDVTFTNITEIKELVCAYSRLDPIGLITVAARPKAWVCSRLLAGIRGLNPVGGTNVSLVSVVVR